ncbi:UNVERIFIED_CONTAM: hypothetical protein Slati_2450900 [Sesamum latifolium]|uniref:Reverse transcriptase n=1 Tax=Sesamum latifolium TaxID=2727402 RepID=A0AAW2WE97_9LAMI
MVNYTGSSQAEEASVILFRDALHAFAELSGLHANISKSQLILSKSASPVRNRIRGTWISGRTLTGTLPWAPTYLFRLTIDDCKPLLLKVDERLQGWSSLHLSFAARIQLLKSIISALNIYWATAFILPSGVLKTIEARMRKFLWQGGMIRGLQRWHGWMYVNCWRKVVKASGDLSHLIVHS